MWSQVNWHLLPDKVVEERQRFFCVYLNTVDNPVDEIIVNKLCIFVIDEVTFPTINHNKNQLITFPLLNSILSIVDNIGLMHDTIKRPKNNLVTIF